MRGTGGLRVFLSLATSSRKERIREEATEMYSLEMIEDTIRIPAEYIEKGKSLSEHVDVWLTMLLKENSTKTEITSY